MKIKYAVHVLAVSVALLVGSSAMADARLEIGIGYPPHSDLDVYVWPDRGIDGVYFPGDPIRVFFEVTRDCYVVIYDIDTRGRLHILFPFDPWQDNYVEAGRVYELPGDWDNFQMTVEGPSGAEFIQAIASPHPIDLPDWPVYINSPGYYPTTCADPELMDFRAGEDRMLYIERVNRKITRHWWPGCATDLARFYVHRRPVYVRPGWTDYTCLDRWPDVFYGEIFIGWPIGSHIYVDGVFVGIAPCWVRGISFGFHWIRCHDGHRVVYEKRVQYRHKYWYRKDHPDYRVRTRSTLPPYRSAPGTPAGRVEKSRKDRDVRVKYPKSDIMEKSRSTSPGDKAGVVRPSRKTEASKEGYKPSGRTRESIERIITPRRSTGEKSSNKGILKSVLSTVGKAVAGSAVKTGKKAKSAKVSNARRADKSVKEKKSSETKNKQSSRRSGSKKR